VALGSDRYASRADNAVFVVCLVLGLVALALPAGLREPIAGAMRRTVLAPLLEVQRRSVAAAAAREQLSAVRAERDSLALDATFLTELRAENARLRDLLGLAGRLDRGFVTAEVLHQAGVADGLTLVLSAGSNAGVAPFSPVLGAHGLLGVLQAVDRRTSVALAWSHPDFRASAMVEGAAIYGIVRARREEVSGALMELIGVPYRDTLPPGTRVVTSGLGGVFPRGIPLGTVQGVLQEQAGWERTYLLRPAVHPTEAAHVIVLSPARAADTLRAAFGLADSLALPRDSAAPARPLRRRVALRDALRP
jgi:rod shape-determining protein MreC